jgi:hypothetical protein
VMYDPALETDPAGPLAVYSALKTAITIPSGGSYLPLHEVTRSPSTVLSASTTADLRRYVGPSYTVQAVAALPADAPVGSSAYVAATDTVFVRRQNSARTAAEWRALDAPDWQTLNLGASYIAVSGATPRIVKHHGRAYIEGAIAKWNATAFVAGQIYSTAAGVIPDGYRPDRVCTVLCSRSITGDSLDARAVVYPDGHIEFTSTADVNSIRFDDGSWFADH